MSKPGRKFTNGRGEGRGDGYAGSNLTSWTYRDATPGKVSTPSGKKPDGSVYLRDPDVTLYHGDVLQVLRELPAESVDCCVTSPPYWGLRDYGTGAWEGGDERCDHVEKEVSWSTPLEREQKKRAGQTLPYRDTCGKCGATRVDQQLGLEPTPEEFVAKMVEVFREVRRVLALHGTVWLNLGDSYHASSATGNTFTGGKHATIAPDDQRTLRDEKNARLKALKGHMKPKDLVGIPWRVAFALQADGWYLRSDIIWAKPNPMPESVTDRPTKAHEYVFLLSKQPRYFFDSEAVREKAEYGYRPTKNGNIYDRVGDSGKSPEKTPGVITHGGDPSTGRNIRSVWEIATQPYPEAHFATFPEELARRCIAAGTSERGKCPECGAPWVREVERAPSVVAGDERNVGGRTDGFTRPKGGAMEWAQHVAPETIGWRPSCPVTCSNTRAVSRYAPVPCVVLDPFIGSGTVAHVARKLGRHAVGIDLNESYLELAARRLQQQSLFAESHG